MNRPEPHPVTSRNASVAAHADGSQSKRRPSHGADLVARASFGTVGFVAVALLPVAAFVGAQPLIYASCVLGVIGSIVGYVTWHRGHHAAATWMHVSALLFVGWLSLLGTGSVGGLTVVLLLASVITAGGLQGFRAAVIDIIAVLVVIVTGYLLGPSVRLALDVEASGLVVPEPLLLIFTLTSIPSWALYVIAIDRSNRLAWQRAEADRASLARTLSELEGVHEQLQLGHEVQLELARLGLVSASALEEKELVEAIGSVRKARFDGSSALGMFDVGAERILEAWRGRQELLTERAALARELQERARHEALERVTGGASHDVNNALMGVIANADHLRHAPGLDEELRPVAEAVVQGAMHASRVVTTLGRYASGIPGAPSVCNGTAVLEEVRPLFEAAVGQRTALEMDISTESCAVRVDRELLERAALNLVRNAVEAAPTDGTGSIRVRVWRPAEVSPPVMTVEVSDDGAGMSGEVLAQSTEPYFSGRERAGLGLTLVQGLANQTGGELAIESEPARGTVVRLSIPLASDVVAPPGNVAALKQSHHVLLVDDDDGVRESVAAMCCSLGFRVSDVATGLEAAAVAEAGLIDFVLCDVRLEAENGFELVRRLRAGGMTAPVLFITGFAGRGQSQAPSGDPVLVKPFRRAELAAAIESLLASSESKQP